ncbi:MAG: tRNA (adenosine(37)-N6)-threonylcarbamoyltransferase complex ATPase subunit type 1 TsaE [Alphaproteobacteria bacterium]|nr:tRNA (adenosine(37)-N6)-threonylcarbamoyltransferase complex ATPase subunit type 1 TsaE [Alphaproteobacteria bacterium]
MSQIYQEELSNFRATAHLAERLAQCLRFGDIVALQGPLGVGKTTFARALIRALGWTESEIPSPTFTLVQQYDLADFSLWHFDLYRLEDAEDAFELGIEEAFSEGVSLIEWPDRLGRYLPGTRLDVLFSFAESDDARCVTIEGDAAWADRLDGLGHE